MSSQISPSLWSQSDALHDTSLVEGDEVGRPQEDGQGEDTADALEANHLERVEVVLVHVFRLVHKLQAVEELKYFQCEGCLIY